MSNIQTVLGNKVRTFLRKTKAGSIFRSLLDRPSISSICFVSATRYTESDFWRKSALGRSSAVWRKDSNVWFDVVCQNSDGLSAVYNKAVENSKPVDAYVFLHDDLWLSDHQLLQKIRLALRRFDVLGLAGNRRRVPRQPAWLFSHRDGDEFVWDSNFLSGVVDHGSPGRVQSMEYGPSPAICELLDGLFLAVRGDVMRESVLRFDEIFRFHFYDMDFCRSARQAGLTLGTWPIDVIHESKGGFGGEEWERQYQVYLQKWRR